MVSNLIYVDMVDGYAWILVRLATMRRTKLNVNYVNSVTPSI
jgi:hypothetical protein